MSAQVQPNQTPTLAGVQMLRGMAALLVVFYHAATNVDRYHIGSSYINANPRVQQLGACGVDIFFVISGFIMMYVSRTTWGAPNAASAFLARRAIRIFPLYWAVTATVVALWLMVPFAFQHLVLTPGYTLASFLLVPHFRPGIPDDINPLVDQGWTLSFEVYFYLLFSLLLKFGRRASVLALLFIIFSLQTMIAHWLPNDLAIYIFLNNPIALEFLFGAVLFDLYDRGITRRIPTKLMLVLAITGYLGSMTVMVRTDTRPLLWGMPSFALVMWSLHGYTGTGPAGRGLSLLGNASYSIYLSHALFVMTLLKALQISSHRIPVPADLAIAGSALLALPFGVLVYRFIELPLTAHLSSRKNLRFAFRRP